MSALDLLDYAARDALVSAVASSRATGHDALQRTRQAVLEIKATLGVLGWEPPAAVRHLEWAPLGRTRLEAALVGVNDEMLDATPFPREWSIRQQLAHAELTYERYSIATLWAVRRRDDEPLLPPPAAYPSRVGEPEGAPGEPLRDIVLRLRRFWTEAIAPLLDIPEEVLQRPTEWHTAKYTVGFRLHRFAAHDLELATDVRRTAAALGVELTAPRLLAMELLHGWGELESALLGVSESLLDAVPAGVETSLRRQVEAIARGDRDDANRLAGDSRSE